MRPSVGPRYAAAQVGRAVTAPVARKGRNPAGGTVMHRILVWAVAVSLLATGVAQAETVDPTAAWRPMYPFLGAWKGTRSEEAREVRVTRVYASAASNHHLEITETGSGRAPAGVWG